MDWFCRSRYGGLITMLALYFTLKQNQEMNQNSQISSLKPYVACNITNLDSNERKILIKNCIDNYGFIECKMRNISNNIANGIKIVEEYSSVEIKKMFINDMMICLKSMGFQYTPHH